MLLITCTLHICWAEIKEYIVLYYCIVFILPVSLPLDLYDEIQNITVAFSSLLEVPAPSTIGPYYSHSMYVYVYIYSPDMDIQKYTVTMKIIVNSVKISSPIGTISNWEVVDLQ